MIDTVSNVWIVGAGGIGCALGAKLAYAIPGRVTFVDSWVEHVEAIRTRGLRLDYPDETVQVRADALLLDELESALSAPDLVVMAVKSYQTEELVRALAPHIGDAPIVSAQNGMNEEVIAGLVGPARTIGAIVLFDGALVEPGHGRQVTVGGALVIGELDGHTLPRTHEVARVLGHAAPVRISANIWGEVWTKLIRNSMINALASLLDVGVGEMVTIEGCCEVCGGLGSEAVRVATDLGIVLVEQDLFNCPPAWYCLPKASPERRQIEESFRSAWIDHPTLIPSMLQDVRKGRATEVEDLNGYVVRKGLEAGVPTPLNAKVTELLLASTHNRYIPNREAVIGALLPLVT